MKRAKIMLIAIAVLATVGGALAFKANSSFGFNYCYRDLAVHNDVTTSCTDILPNYKLKGSETTKLTTYYYTSKQSGDCPDQVCTSTTTLAGE